MEIFPVGSLNLRAAKTSFSFSQTFSFFGAVVKESRRKFPPSIVFELIVKQELVPSKSKSLRKLFWRTRNLGGMMWRLQSVTVIPRFLIDSSCIRFIFPSYILEYPTKVNAIERNKAFWSTAFTFHNSLVDSLAEWPIFTRLESSTSGLSTARYQ